MIKVLLKIYKNSNIADDILIVMIKRKDKVIIQNGNTIIMPEDILVVTGNDLRSIKYGNSIRLIESKGWF